MLKHLLKLITWIFLAGIPSVLYSQKRYGIKHIYSFYQTRTQGTIRINSNKDSAAKGPATINLVYVETISDKIEWINAWKNGNVYSINVIPITQLPFDAGKNKNTNEEILIEPENGDQLWQLDLVPGEEKMKVPVKSKKGTIILEGKYRGKKFHKKICKHVELYSPRAM